MQSQECRSYAGAGPRFAAFFGDWICSGILYLIALLVLTIVNKCGVSILKEEMLFKYTLMAILLYFVKKFYYIVFTSITGQTLGKMCFRIRVVNDDGSKVSVGNVIYRETIGKFISGLSVWAFFGYIVILLDKERRGAHDWLCDTRVIYDPNLNNEKIYVKQQERQEAKQENSFNRDLNVREDVSHNIAELDSVQVSVDSLSEELDSVEMSVDNLSDDLDSDDNTLDEDYIELEEENE